MLIETTIYNNYAVVCGQMIPRPEYISIGQWQQFGVRVPFHTFNINAEFVEIDKRFIFRPNQVGVSEWLNYWEREPALYKQNADARVAHNKRLPAIYKELYSQPETDE